MTTAVFFRFSAWLILGAILFVTVSPIDLRPHTMVTVNFDRGAAFAVVGLMFGLGYPRHWKTVAALLALSAAGFELLQAFSPTRHARVEDAVIKAGGALIGVALSQAFCRLRFRRRQILSGEGLPIGPGLRQKAAIDVSGTDRKPAMGP